MAYKLQEAVIDIGVERIMECINEDYSGFANSSIRTMRSHLQATWYKVLARDKTEAK